MEKEIGIGLGRLRDLSYNRLALGRGIERALSSLMWYSLVVYRELHRRRREDFHKVLALLWPAGQVLHSGPIWKGIPGLYSAAITVRRILYSR